MILSLCVALVGVVAALPGSQWLRAQEASTGTTQELFRETVSELPPAPALVRLLRITADPGSGSPMHSHPGPEYGLIESGSLAVTVRGPATLRRASTTGTPSPAIEPVPNTEFLMYPGDQITYPAGTPMAYRNTGTEPVVFLAAVILPAGHQRPPGLTWTDGPPPEDALAGVSSVVLGEGIAPALASGPTEMTIERLTLPGEAPIPADDRTVIIAVESGSLDVTLVAGEAQISRSSIPGQPAAATPATNYILAPGDALFFPQGMAAAQRSPDDAELVVLRMALRAVEAPPPNGTPAGRGEIAVSTPTPQATSTPTAAAPTATPVRPTTTPQTAIGVGSIVVVTEDGVRLRDAPSTDAGVVTTLAAGQQLEITGPSEEGSGFTWWPVFDPNSGLSGYVAADFIELAE
jgi:quercetin dioxygenase-like cupin family protein